MMPSEERLRVDVTSPYISMLFPALELIIITGITWIIIVYMDSDKAAWFLDTNIRNLMVGIWAALSLWRFVLPTIRLRNRRIMVNDERIIIHSATLRPTTHTIPLKFIRAVNRKRNELILTVIGQPQPVVLRDVAYSRRVQEEMLAAMDRTPERQEQASYF